MLSPYRAHVSLRCNSTPCYACTCVRTGTVCLRVLKVQQWCGLLSHTITNLMSSAFSKRGGFAQFSFLQVMDAAQQYSPYRQSAASKRSDVTAAHDTFESARHRVLLALSRFELYVIDIKKNAFPIHPSRHARPSLPCLLYYFTSSMWNCCLCRYVCFAYRAPFTLQRLCEVLLQPQRQYKQTRKLIHSIEKVRQNVLNSF